MYPDFQFFLQSVFGIDIPALSIFKTFGFFVALAFIFAAIVITKELKRKASIGRFQPIIERKKEGMPPKTSDWLISGIIGFILGFKVIGLIKNASEVAHDPMQYLFSGEGNWLAGLLVGAFFGFQKFREKKKQQLPQPVVKEYKIYPHQRIMDIVFIAAAAGFIGAKIFNAFETWDAFIQDPIGSLFSSGGFTFYGGLICATLALYVYSRMKKFSFKELCDAAAPALMIAYAVGRLGCHFAGDGDWGIYNSAYLTDINNANLIEQVDQSNFNALVKNNPQLFAEFNEIGHVPEKFVKATSGLPTWLYAMNYYHNVNKEGIVINNDPTYYNTALPAAVFPTPIYEFVICSILFLILWLVRKKLKRPLQLFGLYLIFNGLERFFIEKIRVNFKYDWGFIHPTQAEIISVVLIIIGLILLFYRFFNQNKVALKA